MCGREINKQNNQKGLLLFKSALQLLMVAVFMAGCKKAFTPVVTSTNASILVVEGFINTGTDSTIIRLSRTVLVNNKTTVNPERNAIVTVETQQGTVLTLVEIAKGVYASPPVSLDNTKQYRVRIKTSSGKVYLSDLVSAKVTPPIDDIDFVVKGIGIQIYVNAHDAANNARYYRYTFSETWEFVTKYEAPYIVNDTSVLLRTPEQQVHQCYGRDSSARTILNSTAALSQDIVAAFPIVTVDSTSEKLQRKYSILVSQQALSKEAYVFYDNIKKNTEDLGNIFDAQPSLLIGNIHNINDPTEAVIGFISAGTIQKKRIFISRAGLPKWTIPFPAGCKVDTAYYFQPHFVPITNDFKTPRPHTFYVEEALIPLPPTRAGLPIMYFGPYTTNDGYLFSTPICTDCTLRGVNKKPAFWK